MTIVWEIEHCGYPEYYTGLSTAHAGEDLLAWAVGGGCSIEDACQDAIEMLSETLHDVVDDDVVDTMCAAAEQAAVAEFTDLPWESPCWEWCVDVDPMAAEAGDYPGIVLSVKVWK